MKALASLGIGLGAMAVSWILGGPLGGVLNAPGLLLLGAARSLGVLPRFEGPTLSRWIWVGTLLSGAFWTLAAYVVLRLLERRRSRSRNTIPSEST